MLFDLFCKVDVHAVLGEHRWMCLEKSELVGTCGYMDQIHIFLYCLCDSYTLVQIVAAIEQFGTTHTELNREHRANRFTDCLQYLDGKTHTVFKASAVLIGSVVKERGNKLV